MHIPVRPSDGLPEPMRSFKAFLRLDQMVKLDEEILRRKAYGEDRDPDGQRINVNRSLVIRDLIDEKWPPEGESRGS